MSYLAALSGFLLLIGGVFWGGFEFGHSRASIACIKTAADAAAEREQAAEKIEERREEITDVAVSAEQQRQVITRVQTREVIRYVQAHPNPDCGLDADGLRLWQAANAGVDPAALTGSASDGAVPAVADAGERPAERSAAESRGDGAALSPVSRAAAGAGAVGGGRP